MTNIVKSKLIDVFKRYSIITLTVVLFLGSAFSALSYFFSNNNFITQKNASAAQTYVCPEGSLYAPNYCVTPKVPTVVTTCQNGELPDANNNCGQYQNIIWPCAANIAGQILLIEGYDGFNACTFPQLASNFILTACIKGYNRNILNSGDKYDFADRLTNVMNARVTSKGDGPLISTQFCIDNDNNAYNPCPADFRVILPYATNSYDNFSVKQLWCGRSSVLGGTGPNFETSVNTPLYFVAAGRPGSYLSDRRCGKKNAPNMGIVTQVRFSSNHDELTFICHQLNYIPATQTVVNKCPQGGWQDFAFDEGFCFKTAETSNYIVDATSIGNGLCNPNPVIGDTTSKITCIFPLSGSSIGSYVLPNQGVFAGYWESGLFNDTTGIQQSDPCEVLGSSLVCSNLSAVNTSGSDYNRQVFAHIPGEFLEYRSSVQILSSTCSNGAGDYPNCGVCPIGQSLYQGNCILNYGPDDVATSQIVCSDPTIINNFTNCTITPIEDRYITQSTKLRINNGNISTSNCVITSPITATCSNVSTGSEVGSRSIDITFESNQTPAPTGKSAIVLREPVPTDFVGDCIPDSTLVNQMVNCTGDINGQYLYINNLTARISNGGTQNCTTNSAIAYDQYTFSCNLVNVGTIEGLQNVKFRYGIFQIQDFNFDQVQVNKNAVAQSYTLNCSPNTKNVNEFFNCVGTIQPNVLDSNLKARLFPLQSNLLPASAASPYVDCTINGLIINCDPIPSGVNKGLFGVNLVSDSISETLMSVVNVNDIAQISDLSFDCNPDTIDQNSFYDCNILVSPNVVIPYIDIKTSTNGVVKRCILEVAYTNLCENISGGSILGINDIIAFNDNIPQTVVDSVDVVKNFDDSDINLTCNPDSALINTTITCLGTKLNNLVLTNNLYVQVENNTPSNCVVLGLDIACQNINVGNSVGTKNVYFGLDQNGNDRFSFETVNVYQNANINDISLNCLPNIAIVGSSVNCTGSYAENTFVSNLKVKIDQTGIETICTVDNQDRSIACNGVPVGNTKGQFDTLLNSNEIPNDTKFGTINVFQNGTKDSVTLDCKPKSTILSQTVDCVGAITNYNFINGLEVKIGENGSITNCSVTSFVTINCNNVPVGNTPGIFDVYLKSNQFDFTKFDNILVRTTGEPNIINLNCNPDTVLVNSEVVCSGTLNPNSNISNLNIFIDPSNKTQCLIDNNLNSITCPSLNVGQNTGKINIFGTYDQENEPVYIDDIVVFRFAGKNDLTMDCSPEFTLTNSPIRCSGVTSPNTLINNFVITLDNGQNEFALCTQNTDDFIINCENLNSGNKTGLISIYGKEGEFNSNFDFIPNNIIDKVQVFKPFNTNNIILVSCLPERTQINSFVECELEFDDYYIDVNSIQIRNDVTGEMVNCEVEPASTNILINKINCKNIPSGSISGTVPISVGFNNDNFKEKTTIFVLFEPNLQNVKIECGESVVKGGLIECKVSIDQNVNLKSLSLKTNLTDQIANCQITQSVKIICELLKAPNETNEAKISVLGSFNNGSYQTVDTLDLNNKIVLSRTGSNPILLLLSILMSLCGFILIYIQLFKPKITFDNSYKKL